MIQAQSAGGGGAGGGAAAGAAGAAGGGTAAGTVSGGARSGVSSGGRATTTTTPGSPRVGNLNTVGGASITTPSVTPPAGAASTLVNPQNNIGGALNNGGIASPGQVGSAGANATLQGAATATGPAVNFGNLPSVVQTSLQPYAANGSLGTVSQQTTQNGVVYTATVTQNGTPMQLQIAPNGRVISSAPVTGSPAVAGVAGTTVGVGSVSTAGAGLPLTTLPANLQQSILSQVGTGTQIQTISRDDLANGSVYRVTALQNGVPTEFRFAANGTLLASAPVTGGSATSAFTPTAATMPGAAVVLDTLPANLQTAIRTATANGRITGVSQQQTPNGLLYSVNYDQNGRPMRLTMAANGRVLNRTPMNAVGNSPTGVTGSATNAPAPATNTSTNRPTALQLDDLPDKVQETLKAQAPNADIRFINKEQRPDGDAYVVGLRTRDRFAQLEINSKGTVIYDSRTVPVVAVGKQTPSDDENHGMEFSSLPVAIKNAVMAYATASNVREVTLGTDRYGKTVYNVVYYNDGRRDRMLVNKEGDLVRIDHDVAPSFELGSENKSPLIAIGDLPQAVQDTIRRQTDNVRIDEINTKLVGDQTVYAVDYQTNGSPVQLLVSTDGTMVYPVGRSDAKLADSPLPAPLPSKEHEPVRTIDVTGPQVNVKPITSSAALSSSASTANDNAGTSAISEQGKQDSIESAKSENESRPAQKVTLSDVPVPVQSAAKKLAGAGTIESINPKLEDSAVLYEVTYEENGSKHTVQVNKDGKVVPKKTEDEKKL